MGAAEILKRYETSEELLQRAERTIPLGTQTFSKSKTQYPFGVSPYFIVRGAGSRVWDADANEYVDFINALAAVTLGYNDPDVTQAVEAQLKDGVIFSLPHPIEMQVAEKIVELVPCAEMVRFGKNGSDATSGAIRLARAYTGCDRVAVCGYHGWQDWYIGSTTRDKGVPSAVRALTHTFAYNDLRSLRVLLEEHRAEFAAVILEPMNITWPEEGFLEGVKALAHEHGALLIFDEIITGFRFAKGGAQAYFGVTPDLATFGKGLANGFPLSAVAGRAEVMCLMEEIFFSFTFGGETLSLAAALATLKKLESEPVTDTLGRQGTKITKGLAALIERHDARAFASVSGHPAWSFLMLRDTPEYTSGQLKTLLLQELFGRGILSIGTHNMSYAHTNADIQKLLSAYDEILSLMQNVIANRSLGEALRCNSLEPLFKVR